MLLRRAVRALLAGLLAVAGAAVPLAGPAEAATAVVETTVSIPGTPESDGRPVTLDATLLTTDPATPRPAIVLAHGFGGSKVDSLATGRTLARDGYAVIVYTARGFGASGGSIHLDHPDYEGADTVRIVDFAATRAEIARPRNDPVIGFAGASYGGAASFLAGALDPRVDAIVPAFTWHSLRQSLFPQNAVTDTDPTGPAEVASVTGPGVFKQRWASLLFSSAGDSRPGADPLCGRFEPQLCEGYQQAAETGRPDAALSRRLDQSGLEDQLGRITAPTMIIAGEDDTLFPLDQADANLRGLPADTVAKVSWVAGGHDAQIDTDELVPQLESWFGRYLKQDGTPADTRFELTMPENWLVGNGGGGDDEPQTLVAAAYPGRGVDLVRRSFALLGDPQTIIAPPGGVPAALTGLPGAGTALSQASAAAGYPLAVLPGQSATFTSDVLTRPLALTGSGQVGLGVTSSTGAATLYASLWDLGPDLAAPDGTDGRARTGPSTAILPQLAVAPIRLTGLGNRPARVRVALPPVVHSVPVGHRLQLVVATTDQAYANPTRPAVHQITLLSDLQLPVLPTKPLDGGRLDVPLPLVLTVTGLVVAAIAALILSALRRRQAEFRTELADVPLVIFDVAKTYKDGFRAVDGVSFRVERGQVLGLLGPNGAGKTTVLRMLVGLIRPDAGEIIVAGHPVHAGADVLESVGAFIEGPGFLPHLTGRQNLAAYWEATGRPAEAAHLDDTLAIAGLGSALDRKVRGYSQGMRQRLAIAQAMLGRPDLLILDEPTNGLDPPQIKAMRQVIRDYAATGRTVVVSSHLLSEVEQTCSHVVVMNRGRVIRAGSVSEVTTDETGRGHRDLEDVFMGLIDSQAGSPA